MKKIILTTIILSSLLITGCNNDSESEQDGDYTEYCNESKGNRDDENCQFENSNGYIEAVSRYEEQEHINLNDYLDSNTEKSLLEVSNNDYVIYIYSGWCPVCQGNKDEILKFVEDNKSLEVYFINSDEATMNNYDFSIISNQLNQSLSDDALINEDYKVDGKISISSIPTAVYVQNGSTKYVNNGLKISEIENI